MKIDGSIIDFNLLTSEKQNNNHLKFSDKKKLAMINSNGNIDNTMHSESQTPSLIITNYDEIIGDFGKELEQEIGLIMAEYSFMNEANMSTEEFMRLKKMQLHHQSSNVPNSTTSAIILAQDTTTNNFTVTDSPSSNSLVELTTDRVNIFTNYTTTTTSSSFPSHYSASPAALKHSLIIQKMRNASECDEKRSEIYCCENERVVNNKEIWESCVNKVNNNLIVDNNNCYYESIMDDGQDYQEKLANPPRENLFNVIDTKEMNIFMTTSVVSSEYSDDDGCSSDSDTCPSLKNFSHNSNNSISKTISGSLSSKMNIDSSSNEELFDQDSTKIFTNLARLQIEARMALSQAQSMAKMQVELERQKQGTCLITKLVHQTLNKVMRRLPNSKRRLSRWDLGSMNITQLQIIINDFHEFINVLNEILVLYLMERDELSMKQDSILIDTEDITKYIRDKTQYGLAEIMDSS